jgi:hypothetical protein
LELRAALAFDLAECDRDAVIRRREARLQGIRAAFMPEPELSVGLGGCACLVDEPMLAQAYARSRQDPL